MKREVQIDRVCGRCFGTREEPGSFADACAECNGSGFVKVPASWVNAEEACRFIPVTKVMPKWWDNELWAIISDNAPFTWGDNNRSLVTASSFADHCEERLGDSPKVKKWLKALRSLGDQYLDLEN